MVGEVGCVPLGRWQRTWRAAHASDMTTIVEGSFGNVTYLRLLETERTFFGLANPLNFSGQAEEENLKKTKSLMSHSR